MLNDDLNENVIPARSFVTDEELENNRRHVRSLIDSGENFSDPLFGNIFEYIYSHAKNVSTRYSCQGHYNKRHFEMPYVMFVANEEGVVELNTFFSSFVKSLIRYKVPSFYLASLSMNYRIDSSKDTWIPVFIWSFKLPFLKNEQGETIREKVINSFCETVKETWPVEK